MRVCVCVFQSIAAVAYTCCVHDIFRFRTDDACVTLRHIYMRVPRPCVCVCVRCIRVCGYWFKSRDLHFLLLPGCRELMALIIYYLGVGWGKARM